MLKKLMNRFTLLACLLLLISPAHFLKAQICDPGANGVTPVGGGIQNLNNGLLCANKYDPADIAEMNILYTNVNDQGNQNAVEFFIDWDDGTTQTLYYSLGEITFSAPASYSATITHIFPATGANVKCEYTPLIYLQFSGTPCPGSVDSPPPFVRWNTDNENTGVHLLAEENTGVVTFDICAGDSFPVRFSDQSTFNCVPPQYLNLINNQERWTQFIYGTANTITSGTGVTVGGSIETYPYTPPGAPFNDPTPVTVPFATTLDIQVPADASVNQIFEITMNSWNYCNPYPADPPIVTTARIRIIASPAAPSVPPTDFCVGANPTTTASGSGGTFTWYKNPALLNPADVVHVGATFNPSTNPPPADRLSNLVPGSKTYYVTETLGVNNCEGPATAVTFNIIQNPTNSIPGSDFNVCTSTSSLLANNPAVGTGLWTSSGPGNVVAGQEALFNPAIENLASGTTTTFTWTITNGGICVSANSVDVTRDLPPSGSNPGPDISLCTGTTVDMMGVAPAVGTGTWSVVFGPGNVVAGDENLINATIENLTPGMLTTVEWRINNGTCPDEVNTADILNFLDPPSDAGPDIFVCNVTTGNLAATDPTIVAPGSVGTWTWESGPGNVVAGQENLFNAAIENLTAVTPTVFRWSVVNGPCSDGGSTTVVTVEAPPTMATASTPSPTICAPTSTVTGNLPGSGSGIWTWSGGTGNVVAGEELNLVANVENIDPNTTTTFRWTISTGSCGDSFAEVMITNQSPTISIAGSDQDICMSSTTMSANTASGPGETGTWVFVSGSGNIVLGEENMPNANVENMVQGTTTVFNWEIDNGVCPISTSTVSIIYHPAPTLSSIIGIDQTICAATTSITGNNPGAGETGTWTWSGGAGSVVAGQENNPTATVQGMSQGTSTTFNWQIDNAGCTGSPASVMVTRVNNLTVPAVMTDQIVCTPTAILNATPVAVGETGTWTWLGGTANIVSGQENLPNAGVENLTPGTTTTFTWTISNGVCTDLQESVDITQSNTITTPVPGLDQNVCISTTSLAANSPGAGETGTWTWTGGSGNIVAGQENNPSANVENLTQGTTTTFTWTISNGLCTPLSADVLVTFDQLPTSSAAGPDQIVCIATTNLQGNDVTSGIGSGTWTFAPTNTGIGGIISDPLLYNSLFTGVAGETYILRWTISNGTCSDSFSDVTLDFSSALPISTISGDAQACIGDAKTYIIPGGNPTLYDYTWDLSGLPPSTTVVAGTGSPFQFITLQFNDPVAAGVLAVVTDDGFCFSPPEIFGIEVFQTPIMSLISSDMDLIICENESVTFTATDALGLADNFEFQINGITVQSGPSPVYTTTSLASVDQMVVIGTSGGICPASSTPPIAHTVNPKPVLFSIQGGGSFCDGGTGKQIGLDGSEFGTSYELYLGGNPTGIIESPSGGAFNFPPQTQAGIYTVKATTASSCGDFMAGNTSITIDPLPGVFNVTGTGEFCVGDVGLVVGLDNSESGINYQLKRNGVVQGNSIPGTGSGIDFGLQVLPGIYTIVGSNPLTFCSEEMNDFAQLTLIPLPDIEFSNNQPEVCSGLSTSIDLISDVAGATFTWTVAVSDPSLEGASDQPDPQPIGTSIEQTLTNSGSVVQTATYTLNVTGPSSTFCAGDSKIVEIDVYPGPTATISGETAICKGSSTQIEFSTTGVLPFNLTYSDGISEFTLNAIAGNHVINVKPTVTTVYSIVSVTDNRGCILSDPGEMITIEVENTIADLTVNQDPSGCGPFEVSFTNNNIQPGVTYEWSWGDGSPISRTSEPVVSHIYQNGSSSPLTYNMSLIATSDVLGCQATASETIEVFPSITTIVNADESEGCAPLLVNFSNNSIGVTQHKWYYRIKGTNEELEVKTTPEVDYNINNKTVSSLVYEVVYESSNGFCEQSRITEIVVLPELTASFELSQNPVEVTNTPHVTITNNTLNKNSWTHLWKWGDGTTSTEIDPGSHTYLNSVGVQTYGTFQISQEISYDSDLGSCISTETKQFNVVPVFPTVDFEADVVEGCVPLDVNFNNLSIGIDEDDVKWEFYDSQGELIGTSNDYNARYIFFDPGSYTVQLSGGNTIGINETERKELYITVNPRPTAGFTLRPSVVYLPDGIVYCQNQSSADADDFFWIFNYLEYEAGTGSEFDLTSTLYEPEVLYKQEGYKDIVLVATNSITGCSDSTFVEKAVLVEKGGFARVPNAFTPNDRGPGASGGGGSAGGRPGDFNEVFLPIVDGLASEPGSFHMLIYNRWGYLLFESWDEDVGWDGYDSNGNLMPMGVYVYKLDLRFEDGTSGIRIGDITLIR